MVFNLNQIVKVVFYITAVGMSLEASAAPIGSGDVSSAPKPSRSATLESTCALDMCIHSCPNPTDFADSFACAVNALFCPSGISYNPPVVTTNPRERAKSCRERNPLVYVSSDLAYD